ncbi:hypothetical protein K488DRAFT_54524 [Vararia minispora EC-137]|uniref:Uncharacterized protein n=1 Tax=Vararia minispora EC-137 TaxID=1314806 RepID=A0ACB8QEX1_9AGAM|nr:hypothetical protein K488DRAFT_54524 [Vararia minispora EC-137]
MRSWAITGAARGIGLEFVRQLALDKEDLVFAMVRNKERATHLIPIAEANQNVLVLEADATDYEALKAAASRVSEVTGGKLDVIITNHARTGSGTRYWTPITQMCVYCNMWRIAIAYRVNTVGAMHVINAFLPPLRAGTMKHIVAISSAAGDLDLVLRSRENLLAAYAASKAALNIVIAKYAANLRSEGFMCVPLNPGMVNTDETSVAARASLSPLLPVAPLGSTDAL